MTALSAAIIAVIIACVALIGWLCLAPQRSRGRHR